jgi:UDP-2,3-diacylglucosamine hydrolase
MRAVFFSDAHLRGADDEGCGLLLSFLRDASRNLDHLFIVGDLFDFWFSKGGVVYPGFQAVIDELAALQGRGVKIHLFEGNHDFFLAHYFTRYHGIEVFTDEALLQLDGKQVYIAHGDLVDETDRGYRLLRRVLRSRIFFGLQRLLPLPLLWRLARLSSDASKEYLAKPQEGLAAKMEAFALAKFDEGIDAVILGHCHLPALRTHSVGDRQRQFVLLGDWLNHRSYLVMDSGGFDLGCYGGKSL